MLVSLITMAVLVLSSCNKVTITDQIIYGNKGAVGAAEFHTLAAVTTVDLTPAQWQHLLLTQPLICTSVSSFGDYKIAIEQLCSVCNCCSYNTKAALNTLFANIAAIKVAP